MILGSGALLAGGLSAMSNLIGNAGNRRAQKRADRYNREFWMLQNQYNHPSAQMARLREAGLNPNMIYGASPSSATGNAERIQPSKAPEYKWENPLTSMSMYQDTRVKQAQTNNLQAQNDAIAAETALKGIQASKIATDNARSKFDLKVAKDLYQYSVDAARQNVRNMELTGIQKELDNAFKSQTLRDNVKKIMYEAQWAQHNLEGIQKSNILKQLEIDLRKLGIERNDPWYFRILGRNPEVVKQLLK